MAAFAYQKIFIHSFSHSSEMHMWQHSSEKFGTNKFISYKKKTEYGKETKKIKQHWNSSTNIWYEKQSSKQQNAASKITLKHQQ